MSASGREAAAPAATFAVIVALGVERAALRVGVERDPPLGVIQSGPGPGRAASAATAALASGASGLLSFGLAGALRAELEPGAVLLPRRVRSAEGSSFDVDPEWHAELYAAVRGLGLATELGDLLSVPSALTSVAEKAKAAANAVVAADMESAAIAAVALRAGARFVALRVVVDAAGDELPADVERWIDERGERRLGAALSAALNPAQWRGLWMLAQRYRAARRTLARLAPIVAGARRDARASAAPGGAFEGDRWPISRIKSAIVSRAWSARYCAGARSRSSRCSERLS
jgi:adenosylhomocysteine nucleosidase